MALIRRIMVVLLGPISMIGVAWIVSRFKFEPLFHGDFHSRRGRKE